MSRDPPVLMPDFITEVEASNPSLSISKIVDHLVWKGCVNYSFSKDSPSRPLISYLMWEDWVKHIKEYSEEFSKMGEYSYWSRYGNRVQRANLQLEAYLDILTEAPMNSALLSESGIGNAV